MFSATYQLLEQEAYLVRSCLNTGLTALRKANISDKGLFYTAFFQLSIGIERMVKLALILDHMSQNNNAAPGKKSIKDYGHNLTNLLDAIKAISSERKHHLERNFDRPIFADRLLVFLSDFSMSMRYANLDALAQGNDQRKPLNEFNELLNEVIDKNIHVHKRISLVKTSENIAAALEQSCLVIANDLSGHPLTLATALSAPTLINRASRYLVYEIMAILEPLRDFIVAAANIADRSDTASDRSVAYIPCMSEFFDFILADWKNTEKKRWP